MPLREIITLADDYEVAKTKATIAVWTVAWCKQVENIVSRIKEV